MSAPETATAAPATAAPAPRDEIAYLLSDSGSVCFVHDGSAAALEACGRLGLPSVMLGGKATEVAFEPPAPFAASWGFAPSDVHLRDASLERVAP